MPIKQQSTTKYCHILHLMAGYRNFYVLSFKLKGKSGSSLLVRIAYRMIAILDVLSQYDPKNIYDMDESALFYRLSPNRTYLTAKESRRHTKRTEFQKHKRRISIVMCVNCDYSYIRPLSYMGTATNMHCFGDPRFNSLEQNIWRSRTYRWTAMDSGGR